MCDFLSLSLDRMSMVCYIIEMENEYINNHPLVGQLCLHKKCDMGMGIALLCKYVGLRFEHPDGWVHGANFEIPEKSTQTMPRRNPKKAFQVFWFEHPECDSFIIEDYLDFETGQKMSDYKKYNQTDKNCPLYSSKKEKK